MPTLVVLCLHVLKFGKEKKNFFFFHFLRRKSTYSYVCTCDTFDESPLDFELEDKDLCLTAILYYFAWMKLLILSAWVSGFSLF